MNRDQSSVNRRGESGTTLFELLLVMSILGILANLALPVSLYVIRRAHAQSVVADFLVIQQAVVQYHSDKGGYPAETSAGGEPVELRPYLKGRVNWNNTRLRIAYDWENWLNATGELIYPRLGIATGVTVVVSDPQLLPMLLKVCPGPYILTNNNTRLTLAIEKPR